MNGPNILNTQLIERRHHNIELDVQSIFYTIQGEGPFCGTPAVFIRLAGCNLMCPSCDTDYTSKRQLMSTDEIVDRVRVAPLYSETASEAYERIVEGAEDEPVSFKYYSGLVVITGGEPTRQPVGLELLVLKLQQRLGCYVQIETNGVLPPPDLSTLNRDVAERKGLYIVVSPKTGRVNPLTEKWACAYKYVMNADRVASDGLPQDALHHVLGKVQLARPPANFKGLIYLQPQDDYNAEQNERNQKACVRSCMRHGYVLQLQTHKLLGLE